MPSLGARGLVVDLPAAACTPAVLAKLKELFEAHPGGVARPGAVPLVGRVTPLEVGSYRVDPAAAPPGRAPVAARRRRRAARARSGSRPRQLEPPARPARLVRVHVQAGAADLGAERADERRLVPDERRADRLEPLPGAGSSSSAWRVGTRAGRCRGEHVARGHRVVRDRGDLPGGLTRDGQVSPRALASRPRRRRCPRRPRRGSARPASAGTGRPDRRDQRDAVPPDDAQPVRSSSSPSSRSPRSPTVTPTR